MSKRGTYETMARDAAAAIEAAQETGQQLTFLADPDRQGGQMVPADSEAAKRGRPKGSKNKNQNRLEEYFAAQGWSQPHEVLAQVAGLTDRGDIFEQTMAATEKLIAWAFYGATERVKVGETWETVPVVPTAAHRLALFSDLYAKRLRALEALLPYTQPKVTPDVNLQTTVQVAVVPSSGAGPAPQPGRTARGLAPPPLPEEMEQNQQVIEVDPIQSDKESRTE